MWLSRLTGQLPYKCQRDWDKVSHYLTISWISWANIAYTKDVFTSLGISSLEIRNMVINLWPNIIRKFLIFWELFKAIRDFKKLFFCSFWQDALTRRYHGHYHLIIETCAPNVSFEIRFYQALVFSFYFEIDWF